MIAYRFLAKGALGPVSGFAWPEPHGATPGAWVSAADEPFGLGLEGVQVCRAADLAHWLHDELWIVETDGEQRVGIDCVWVARAQLLRRIDAWHMGGALRFSAECARHAAAIADRVPERAATLVRGYLDDALAAGQAGYFGVSAHAAALAAALAGSEAGVEASEERAYRAERTWQSGWIVEHVISPAAR